MRISSSTTLTELKMTIGLTFPGQEIGAIAWGDRGQYPITSDRTARSMFESMDPDDYIKIEPPLKGGAEKATREKSQ